MSDEIEKFITDNRDGFDSDMPGVKIWNRIDASLSGKKNKKRITIFIKWSMAAAAVLLTSIAIYINFNQNENIKSNIVQVDKAILQEEPAVNEFAKMIVLKQEELKTISKEQPALYNKFTKDIIRLDSSYQALKNQFHVTPNKEMLVEAMIQNLQLQLAVLNQQLNIIKQIKQSKDYDHEKIYPSM